MSRTQVLGAIRASIAKSRDVDLERRQRAGEAFESPRRPLIPQRGRRPPAEWSNAFGEEMRRHGGDVFIINARADIPACVAAYLTANNVPQRLRIGESAFLAALPWQVVPAMELMKGSARDGDTAAISTALAGVAETGTVVLATGSETPASLALLPDVHIVTLASSALCGSFEHAMQKVQGVFGPQGMPRSLNLISGPSRTGDIGGRIVLGAHGPRRLGVLIYAD